MRKYFNTPTIKVYDPMIARYRCGQSTFSSFHHVAGQKKAKMDKTTMTKAPEDQNQSGQNPQKWENDCNNQGVRSQTIHNQRSRHSIMWVGEKQKWTKAPQDERPKGTESRRTKHPKWENILILHKSRCMIPWSHDTGVDNQHSRHAITWPHREKQKWTKAL